MKRIFDLTLAAMILVILSPVMAAVACTLRLSEPGPIIYRGLRVGRDGRLFDILKFRTMSPNAGAGHEITVKDDPRVTQLGRLLRVTKLDELPQLINVLRGEMSLVGPRPESPHYVAHYTAEQRAVLSVRPGITGPSQVLFCHEERILGGPNPEWYYLTVVMPAKLAIDLAYVRKHSLWRDLKLLASTCGAWVSPTDAARLLLPAGDSPHTHHEGA